MRQRTWLEINKEKIEKEEENIKNDKTFLAKEMSLEDDEKSHLLSLIKDGAAIRVFLSDQNAIDEGLKKLNGILEAEQKNFPNNKKLLRTVIERELAKLGFEGKMAKTHELLSSRVFLYAVSQKTFIKDPGAPPSHGEFTHAIQWLLIGWGNEKNNFLSKGTADFYQELGVKTSSTKDSLLPVMINAAYAALWNCIVDEEENDNKKLLNPEIKFTCPDYLFE